LVWVKLVICILIIFFAGKRVARYGDILAERTGLGGVWIGVILIAMITSLPELLSGVSAITIVDSPNLTVGNLLGANAFNLLNLAFLDIFYRNTSLFSVVSRTHRLTGWFSFALVFIVAASVLIGARFPNVGLGWIGWYTPVIVILYLFFVRKLFLTEQKQPPVPEAEQDTMLITMKRVWISFGIASAFIIGAGIWLPIVGEEIVMTTGWGESFVGSLLLAFTTSLPEITVSFAAIRIGAVDMAVANMIGSNLFNMTIIPIDDIIYVKGHLLSAVSESHAITGAAVLLMTLVFIVGLRARPKRYFRFSWCNLLLILLFIISAYFSFTVG